MSKSESEENLSCLHLAEPPLTKGKLKLLDCYNEKWKWFQDITYEFYICEQNLPAGGPSEVVVICMPCKASPIPAATKNWDFQ